MVTDKPEAPTGKPGWPDWQAVLVLLAITAGLHAAMLARSEVMARDAIGFVRYALLLEEHPWAQVVDQSLQHPGYPAFLLAVSWPVRALLGTSPDSLMLSGQLANALAATLLVIPFYYLGRELFDTAKAFAAALLFQALPVMLEVTSDALSEGLYLLMLFSSLCLAAQGLRSRSAWRFAAAGLCGGLAYLTRPEGALTILTAGVLLVSMQAVPSWRWPWRKLAAGLACLGLGALAGGSPYLAVTGCFTQKPSPALMIKGQKAEGPQERQQDVVQRGRCSSLPLACLLAVWWDKDQGAPTMTWGSWAVASETSRSLQYFLGLPFLIGLFGSRRWWGLPQAWLLQIIALLNAAILVWLATSVGYVSQRHTLLIVGCCMFPLILGLYRLAELGQAWLRWPWLANGKAGLVLALVVAAVLTPVAQRPLHANRAGHRAAGRWLASHAQAWDIVVDPLCWAHFYSGQVLLEGKKPTPPPGSERVGYVVVERGDNPHFRHPSFPVALDLAAQGARVYRWEPSGWLRRKADVVEIYAVPLSLLQGGP